MRQKIQTNTNKHKETGSQCKYKWMVLSTQDIKIQGYIQKFQVSTCKKKFVYLGC